MDSEQIIETWNLFSDYLSAKDKTIVATKFVELVIVAPPLCAAAVVPATPLVTPVSSPVAAIPV